MGKRRSKKGRSAKNAQKSLVNNEPESLVKAPHCFVIHRGHLGKNATQLMINFRKIMEPFTASQLRVNKHNVLKDFIHIAGPLNVTHLIVFTKSEIAMYMKVIRLPRGPTLTFRIHEYCLAKDVVSALKKAVVYEKLFNHHPLLVLNNFTGEGLHLKLMTTMFQGMLPSININKANLNTIRRCLLINHNSDKTIDLRHYAIKLVPCGVSKAVKKLIQNKVPNLSSCQDISEFVNCGNFSDSEAEVDGALNQVVLPQPISSRGNITSQKSAIRLHELGPRMKLQLIKIEEGIVSGDVLFHEYIKKTPEEVAAIKARRKKKMELKAQRRAQQEQNVKRKEQAKAKVTSKKNANKNYDDNDDMHNNEDSDEEWYQKEVGEQPDKDLMSMSHKRKKTSDSRPAKKVRFSDDVPKDNEKDKSPKTLQAVLVRRKKKRLAKLKKRKAQKKSSQVRAKKHSRK